MPNKRQILQSLSRPVLLDLSRFFEIPGTSGKPKDDIIDALMGKRSISVEEILGQLSRDYLKGICEALGLDSSGKKNVLIERISGDKMEPQAGKEKKSSSKSNEEYSLAKQPNSSEKDAKAYVHEESKVSLRPEIGTQAQFKKKKPPRTYKYDSSLSPELEYDGQNSAREKGEELISNILDAKTIEEAKDAAAKLKAMSKPFLNWAGKAERLSFDVPTLPLFVHERLSTKAIIETLKSHRKKETKDSETISFLDDIFGDPHHSIADQVLKAYEYQDKWVNRMVLGDSLVVMNSLLHFENMGGQVQMIFMDPPYGVRFGSNFQPFVRKNKVEHNDDDELTREPEMVKAYRDTWELGVHSYLTYLRDRLLIARDLLKDSGAVFVQINEENMHHVREVLDDIFGPENYIVTISFTKTSGQTKTNFVPIKSDSLIMYAKSKDSLTFRQLYTKKVLGGEGSRELKFVEFPNGEVREELLTDAEKNNPNLLPKGSRVFGTGPIVSSGFSTEGSADIHFEHEGKKVTLHCGQNRHWTVGVDGTKHLWDLGRLIKKEGLRIFKRYFVTFPIHQSQISGQIQEGKLIWIMLFKRQSR